MNLVFHQLKKDMRRTRVVLGLWLALVVMRFALIGWNASPGDTAMQSLFATLSVLTSVLGMLLILVLVPLVIHQEPLVGTSAFWFTRPLSRSTLLRAKGCYALILVLLPLIVQSIVFLTNGVTVHDVALAVPELLLSQMSWMLAVATLAVLTPSFGRFVIVGASVLVIEYLVAFGLQIFRLFHDMLGLVNTPASLTQSRSIVSSLILIGFGLVIVIGQYFTRRTARSIGLAIAGLVLSELAGQLWPWNFLKPTVVTVGDSQFHEAAIAVTGLSGRPYAYDVPSLRGGEPSKQVNGSVALTGCPAGYVVRIEDIHPTLKSADGRYLPLNPVQSNSYSLVSAVDPDAIEQAVGGIPVVNRDNYNPGTFVTLCNLNADTYARYDQVPLAYSAQLSCVAYRCTVSAELPLTKGARFVDGSDRETITNVLGQGDGAEIQLQRQSVRLLFAPTPDQDRAPYGINRSNVIYVLLNRKRREAVQQKRDNAFDFSMFTGQNILNHQPVRLTFGPDNNQPNAVFPTLDHAWLADAVLVRLQLTPVDQFTKTLSIPGFRLDGKFETPTPSSAYPETDAATLEKIVLPPNANRQQTSDYINAILVASRRQERFTDQDPEIEMLKQVGAQNVDLLIQMAGDNHNYYLNRVINDLAQPDHKEMVLAALATNHDLIETVFKHRWQKDAEPTLLAGLADPTEDRNQAWVGALASLHDPATYPALANYFIAHPHGGFFRAIQTLPPPFDLAGTVDQAWKKYPDSSSWQVRELLQPAAQFGEPGVLDAAVKILQNKSANDFSRQAARRVLRNDTPATGATDADLIDWMAAHESALSFDRQAKKFVLAPAPAPH
jgi:hypothetical protein